MNLPNETKIKFCNAFFALETHRKSCPKCVLYLEFGDGDLCGIGKDIIALEMAYMDTDIEVTSRK